MLCYVMLCYVGCLWKYNTIQHNTIIIYYSIIIVFVLKYKSICLAFGNYSTNQKEIDS